VKKGRHRRYEEARALKRASNDDIESLIDRLDDDPFDLPVTKEAQTLYDSELDDEYESEN
jgi:hypothetical protein